MSALLRECELSASDFAAHRNVTPQHVNNWFKRGVPLAKLDEIAELLCVQSKWLRSGEGPKHPNNPPRLQPPAPFGQTGTVAYWADLAASTPDDILLPFFQEDAGQLVRVPARSMRLPRRALQKLAIDPTQALCLNMPGNSMADRLQHGSTLAIDRQMTRIIEGEIYALLHDGMLRVKYLYQLPGGALRLRSHNSAEYPDELFSAEEVQAQGIKIVGWVFWWATLREQRPG